MQKSQFNIFIIVVTFSIFTMIKGSQLVTQKDLCTCEQLLYENECLANKICNFSNQKCTTIPCDLLSAGNCGHNEKCALVNNQCVVFQSCSSHNVKTEAACNDLYHNCYFDDNNQTCQQEQIINFGSCSEDLSTLCYKANEGLCIRKNGVCQEMTMCEDAQKDDFKCDEAFPACEKKFDKCESRLECNQFELDDCRNAKQKINGDKYYLCIKESNGCVDFDPSFQTKDTCGIFSQFYYHWDGKECSRCSWDSIMNLIIIVVLLTLSI